MTSNYQVTISLFISLNLLFFAIASATQCSPPPPRNGGGNSNGSGNGNSGGGGNGGGGTGNGGAGGNGGGNGNSGGGGNGGGGNGNGGIGRCPRDALKLGVCANLLGGLIGPIVVGNPPTSPCCSLIAGIADLEAAACLCTAIRANLLGINLNIPISLSLVLNNCGRQVPNGFTC